MPKILFLTLHRKDRSPGQRFRHEQYLDHLEENGFQVTYSNLLNEHQDTTFYNPGNYLGKVFIGFQAIFKRLKDVLRASKYEYVFIYRDAFFFGILFEWLFRRTGKKLIFDFDDSIWIEDENPDRSIFQRLKNPAKTDRIISYCDLIVAGNNYLAEYACQHNEQVVIIPTTIDTNEYVRKEGLAEKGRICIGWSGSFSTIKHFEQALEPLKIIKDRFKDQVCFKVIGDGNYRNDSLDIKGLPWKKQTEIEDLSEIDIGIMPLPNDNWSKGKCGLKGLQYMALEIPTIMSPVGVNSTIIEDGHNGFLAGNTDEWVEKLTLLINEPSLRKQVGKAGRQTVVDHYSVDANKKKWLDVFQC